MHARSDAKLASAAAVGDDAAFGELYERHAAAIYGYCRRVLRSREEAADATHEAFVSVLERVRDASRPITSPRAYLFRAAHHSCLRHAEGRRRFVRGEPPEHEPESADVNETERIVLTRELQDDVRAANAELSVRHREVLALREVERLTYDEIAQIMDITPNAAAQLAWRARASLRHRMRRRAFAAVTLETLECQRALELLELAEDAALSPAEARWLTGHLATCSRCSSNRAVLAEVGATYRGWAPAGALPLLAGAAAGGIGATTAATSATTAVTAGGVAVGSAVSAPSVFVAAAVGLAAAAGGMGGGGAQAAQQRFNAIAAVPTPLVAQARTPLPRRAPRLTVRPPRSIAAPPPRATPPLRTAPPKPPAPASPPVPAAPAALPTAAAPMTDAPPDAPALDPAPAAAPAPAPVEESLAAAVPAPAPAQVPAPKPVQEIVEHVRPVRDVVVKPVKPIEDIVERVKPVHPLHPIHDVVERVAAPAPVAPPPAELPAPELPQVPRGPADRKPLQAPPVPVPVPALPALPGRRVGQQP